jgi:hypothetical protein
VHGLAKQSNVKGEKETWRGQQPDQRVLDFILFRCWTLSPRVRVIYSGDSRLHSLSLNLDLFVFFIIFTFMQQQQEHSNQ